jgi:hypothetical protein
VRFVAGLRNLPPQATGCVKPQVRSVPSQPLLVAAPITMIGALNHVS